jgi:hypothetical protein
MISQNHDLSSIKELEQITNELERKSKKTIIDKIVILCRRIIKR